MIDHFGTTASGETVNRITLDNSVLRIGVITLGATLQDVRLANLPRGLTLGSERLADYEKDGPLYYFGGIAGPVANRIRKARAEFDGGTLTFEANGLGGHCLHGGDAGLHRKLWEIESATDTRLVLSTVAADGEGGFPGNRRWEAEFVLGEGADLTLRLRAETDAPTPMNLANHSYWNLGDAPDFHGHTLQIHADSMLLTDDTDIATGDILDVTDTPFDFRKPQILSAEDVLDNNFCLGSARGALEPACSLAGPDGLRMDVETTEPGLQVYDARHLPVDGTAGHDGRRYGPRCGIAIEAQFWPDALSHTSFPSIRMEPGDAWEQVTRFSFVQT